MSRLQAVPFGTGVLLVPDWCHPSGDQRIPTTSASSGRRAARSLAVYSFDTPDSQGCASAMPPA